MIAYKLTNEHFATYRDVNCVWKLNKKRVTRGKVSGEGKEGWMYFSLDPYLGLLLNPIQGRIKTPRIFEAQVGGKVQIDLGMEGRCTELTLLREIPLPALSIEQIITFGLHCARVFPGNDWNTWADAWLSGDQEARHSAIGKRMAQLAFNTPSMSLSSFRAGRAAEQAALAVANPLQVAYHVAEAARCAAQSIHDKGEDPAPFLLYQAQQLRNGRGRSS